MKAQGAVQTAETCKALFGRSLGIGHKRCNEFHTGQNQWLSQGSLRKKTLPRMESRAAGD
jgi:hypothetical protein